MEMDELAKQDHTYHLSKEEFKRYQGQWYLTLNKSGKNAPVRLRPDFRAAVSLKNRLHRESARPIALRQHVFAVVSTVDLDPWFHKVHPCDAIPSYDHCHHDTWIELRPVFAEKIGAVHALPCETKSSMFSLSCLLESRNGVLHLRTILG